MTQATKYGHHQSARLSGGVFITTFFKLISILACVQQNGVCGLQSSVLADLKQVERASGSSISNKVKRAQEVVMFGNQQNRLSDHNNYVRTDKRDIPNIPVPDVQNNLDKDEIEEPIAMASIDPMPPYSQLAAARARYFYDRPDLYDGDVYEDRQKRNVMKGRPVKRSDRIFRTLPDDGSRTKRESQLGQVDPEELLSLLAMWEEEQQQRHNKFSPSWRNSQRNGHEYESYPNEILNDIENEESTENEEWLDGPVQHRFTIKPRFYPPYNNNLMQNRQTRKYKSSPDNEYARILSQLSGNNGRPDQHALLQRRYLL